MQYKRHITTIIAIMLMAYVCHASSIPMETSSNGTTADNAINGQLFYLRWAIASTFLVAILSISFYTFYTKKKNIALQKHLLISEKLQTMSRQQAAIKAQLKEKERIIEKAQRDIAQKEATLQRINKELTEVERQLNLTKTHLEEKQKLSISLMQMLHQSKLEESASDTIENIRESAMGKKILSSDDWHSLFTAVDNLYPEFKDTLIKSSGSINEQQIKVCYLMRIGLANPQIKNITDYPRTTIWRWTNMFKWIYEISEKD